MQRVAAIRPITGRHHPLLKRIRAIVRSGELLGEGEVLLETSKLIEDAIASGADVDTVLVRADARGPVRSLATEIAAGSLFEIDPKLFPELTSTENNPGIIALASAPKWREQDLFAQSPALIVILAGLQDPGNLGTILRAAEAFGASGVVTTKGTVSAYNAKAIRAASGTLFRLPILPSKTPAQIIDTLHRHKMTLLASAAKRGESLATTTDNPAVDVTKPVAVAFGSEGAGLPRELEQAGIPVSIPRTSRVESLNVAMAASVLLYEIARQRHLASDVARESAPVFPDAGTREGH